MRTVVVRQELGDAPADLHFHPLAAVSPCPVFDMLQQVEPVLAIMPRKERD